MAFNGPAAQDLANVYSLNATLLDVLAAQPNALDMPAALAARIASLDATQRERLARTPLLLLSVAEDDVERWAPVSESRPRRDLVSEMQKVPPRMAELLTATLGFLWQLACRDAYAARVVSGASVEWCEKLADALLVDVLEFGAREPGLPVMRLADDRPFWNKLLTAGIHDEREVRRAARLSALHGMLTGPHHRCRRPLRTAACTMPHAAMVAERNIKLR